MKCWIIILIIVFLQIGLPFLGAVADILEAVKEYVVTIFAEKISVINYNVQVLVNKLEQSDTQAIGFSIDTSDDYYIDEEEDDVDG